MRVDHDQIFKTLIENFFQEFMELFCPDEARLLDFDHVEFLREEIFTDLPRGEKRMLDLVVKVRLKKGGVRFILVHFEFESRRRAIDYPRRMFEYFCQLFLRHGTSVVAVTVFTDDRDWKSSLPEVFELKLTDKSWVRYHFHAIQLRKFDYRKFLESSNPLAYALMAKMQWSRREIVRMKADFLRLILRTGVDPARRSLLIDFVETYMPLVASQQREFLTLVAEQEPYREVQEMVTSYEKAGIRKGRKAGRIAGREEGREEGRLQAKRQTVLDVARRRFGDIPAALSQRIERETDIALLDGMLFQIVDGAQLADIV